MSPSHSLRPEIQEILGEKNPLDLRIFLEKVFYEEKFRFNFTCKPSPETQSPFSERFQRQADLTKHVGVPEMAFLSEFFWSSIKYNCFNVVDIKSGRKLVLFSLLFWLYQDTIFISISTFLTILQKSNHKC